MMRGKLGIILIAVVAVIIGAGAGYQYVQKNHLSAVQACTVFAPSQEITDFSLIDTKGRPFNNRSFVGQWTFLFFGFTNCTQICPPAMNNLNKMYQILLTAKQNPMPQVVLVSIDPENDTLDKLSQYVTAFNPHFEGVTGDKNELDKLAASLNVLYIKQKNRGSDEVSIDHSGAILLINPAGKLSAIFSAPHDPQLMAKDFQLIVKNSG